MEIVGSLQVAPSINISKCFSTATPVAQHVDIRALSSKPSVTTYFHCPVFEFLFLFLFYFITIIVIFLRPSYVDGL